ncbi:ent-kaurenoic acid oxidase 1-like [Impatiens glandulifera]|uniref:ent-kaurenoic acid oxidase 1-like n=1 Tax=Impatiens glandulifera TaxID=253017 RepID=UPI001FB05579|nr:ent-kaurenoic acid oxidase 1-like [Impatiens glandulifera]
MEYTVGILWVTWALGTLPLMGLALWFWNDIRYCFPHRKSTLPPGHMGLPIIGEMLNFLWYFKVICRPDDFINAKRQKHGKGEEMFRSHLFGSPSIIVCSPSMSKFVLQSSDDLFKMAWPSIEIIGHKSLVSVHGIAHMRLRNFILKIVNQPQSLRHTASLVQPRIVKTLELWAHKGRVIASHEIRKVTFENIGKFFAGFEPGHTMDSLAKFYEGVIKGFRATPLDFPGTAYRHALQSRKKVIAIFRDEMEKRRENKEYAMSKKNDVLNGLMELKDEDGNNLDEIEILDNILSLVVAGYESTSLSIMWAIYNLAKYPDVLEKVREENMKLRKRKNGQFITSDDIANELKYTNNVVEETIRVANVSAFVFRTVSEDIIYKGYKIPKDWKLIVWSRYIHTNPEYYEDPMCFNPDRWNKPSIPGTNQVFGMGPRTCAGNMLARLQVAIFIHHLAVGYEWKLVNPDAKIIYLPHPKLADGVEIHFTRLESK